MDDPRYPHLRDAFAGESLAARTDHRRATCPTQGRDLASTAQMPRRRALLQALSAGGLAAVLAGCALPNSRGSAPALARDAGAAGGDAVRDRAAGGTSSPTPAAGDAQASGADAGGRPARIGLALGGGAARGFAHVGVLRELEEAGIRPALVVGTSAGSVVGALYASGIPPQQLETVALALDKGALGDWSLSARSLMRGQALQAVVNRHVGGRRIERFPIPYAAIVTDLYNGQMRVLRSGDAGLAARASSAVPGVFEPVSIAGREYVDGGLSSPVPVRVARSLGADVVIAVDISAKPTFQPTDSMAEILLQTFTIMSGHLADAELREADVVLRPEVGDVGSADFSDRQRSVLQGRMAARKAMARIRALAARRVQ